VNGFLNTMIMEFLMVVKVFEGASFGANPFHVRSCLCEPKELMIGKIILRE
jgi:hypothetical protein